MSEYGFYTPSDELYHHGIKGQKWGVRRFQNEDGTFNEAGKRRYFGKGAEERRQKAEQNRANIEKKVKNAKSAEEMESAMFEKVKDDIRRDQWPVSRFLNDFSGFNNQLARQVVSDVRSQMINEDRDKLKGNYTRGQKFVSAFVFMNDLPGNEAAKKYNSSGYKKLDERYEKYKNSGGIKKSKRRVYSSNEAARRRKQEAEKAKQHDLEREYQREKKQKEYDTMRTIQQMNAQYNHYKNYGTPIGK